MTNLDWQTSFLSWFWFWNRYSDAGTLFPDVKILRLLPLHPLFMSFLRAGVSLLEVFPPVWDFDGHLWVTRPLRTFCMISAVLDLWLCFSSLCFLIEPFCAWVVFLPFREIVVGPMNVKEGWHASLSQDSWFTTWHVSSWFGRWGLFRMNKRASNRYQYWV